MKNIYHKAKGKIHPSPAAAPPAVAGIGLSSSKHNALEVLSVLPAAILVLTAALTSGDKEVLAYLVIRSLHGPAAATAPAERKRERGPGAAHRPLLDCGCFDCYTSFWSRWDASPDRELIHQAIEAFEEHLASAEKRGAGRGARRRESRRRMDRAGKVKERAEAAVAEEEKKMLEEPKTATEAPTGEETSEERSGEGESVATDGEKRRRWADVKDLFHSVFWNLWGPAV